MAVCPETGENYSLILSYANKQCMDVFMSGLSEYFSNYRIIIAMDRASRVLRKVQAWHKIEKFENIVPLFQPAYLYFVRSMKYSPEVNPVENVWHYIREDGGFTCTAYEVRGKNATFNSLDEVELKLAEKLKILDEKTIQSITLYRWIKDAVCYV